MLKAQHIDGVKVLRYRLTIMDNMTGAIVLAISVGSASMDDPAFVKAAQALAKLHPKLQWLVLWLDNPYRDLQGALRRFPGLVGPLGSQYAFQGEVKICTAAYADQYLDWLSKDANDAPVTLLGFDLEWVPSRQRGVSPSRVALVQLCAGAKCLLVRTHQSETLPPALCQLLLSTTLVGLNLKGDLTKLVKDFRSDFSKSDAKRLAANAIDVAVEIRKTLPTHSKALEKIVLSVTGKTLFKPAGDAVMFHQHWGDEVLSPALVNYAAADAAAPLEVYNVLQDQSASQVASTPTTSSIIIFLD